MIEPCDLQIIRKLQEGNFWITHIVKFKHSNPGHKFFFELRAMRKSKVIEYNEFVNIKKELEMRARIRHKYLCNLIHYFQDHNYLFLISDFPLGGYLHYFLNKKRFFDGYTVRFFSAQIILALQYLHKKNIIYKYLSPDTVFLTEKGNIKLKFDFCNSMGLTEDSYKRNIEYVPIDYIREKKVYIESDFWSLGVLIFKMFTGYTPFTGKSYEDTILNMQMKRVGLPFNDREAENFIERCLDKYNFRRLGYDKRDYDRIKKGLFFKCIDWVKLEKGELKSPLEDIAMPGNFDQGYPFEEVFKTDFNLYKNDGYGYIFDFFNPKERRFLMDKNGIS